jgi:hypothetical protein
MPVHIILTCVGEFNALRGEAGGVRVGRVAAVEKTNARRAETRVCARLAVPTAQHILAHAHSKDKRTTSAAPEVEQQHHYFVEAWKKKKKGTYL